jgi:hypothetical protein
MVSTENTSAGSSALASTIDTDVDRLCRILQHAQGFQTVVRLVDVLRAEVGQHRHQPAALEFIVFNNQVMQIGMGHRVAPAGARRRLSWQLSHSFCAATNRRRENPGQPGSAFVAAAPASSVGS